MLKKIIWLVLIIVLIGFGLYLKQVYPGSQLQLSNSLKHVSATPIEHYFNATEKNCGIWYESTDAEGVVDAGKKNDDVKACFQDAFDKCLYRNILLVDDNGLTEEGRIRYSLVRVVKPNDQNECIIQNYYEEYDVNKSMEEQIPLNFINTCTVLEDEEVMESCKPAYIDEIRKQMMAVEEEEVAVEATDGNIEIEVETNIE